MNQNSLAIQLGQKKEKISGIQVLYCANKARTYLVVWERMANSGMFIVQANNSEEAIERVGYNPDFVKMTVVEIMSVPEVVGQQN